MKEKLNRFLNIRQGESLYVSYLLLHYFFQGLGLSILFIVANTLFLSHFEIDFLPVVFICSAVVLGILGKVDESLGESWPVPKMLLAYVVFITFTVFMFFIGALSLKTIWLPFALYIWYQVVNLEIDGEFWILSSFLFDVRQAKRLYGLISVGDVPAKLLGSLAVALLAPLMGGVSNLLVVAGFSFLVGSLILKRLLAKVKPHHFPHHESENAYTKLTGLNLLTRFFKSDLVMALSILYLTAAIVLTFIEFSFLSGVEHKFHTQTDLANFFAIVFAVGNGIIILCKLFFSGKVIARLGVKRSLLSLPLFLFLICIAMVVLGNIFPGEYILMWFFTVMIVFSEVFKAVLYEPLFLALFQPLPAEIRHRAHGIIGGIIDPLGLGLSGLSLYIGIRIYHDVNLYNMNFVLIALIGVWIVLVVFAVRKYMDALKTAVNRRMIDSGQLHLGDENSIKVLKSKLKSERADEVIYASEILSKSHLPVFESAISDLLAHPVPEVRLYTLNTMQELKLKADSELLYDIVIFDVSAEVCEAAVKLYCSVYEDIVDRITPILDSPDPLVKAAAIKGFLKSGDLEPMIIGGQQLLKMLESKSKDDLLIAIATIGDLGFRNYYKPILDLLSRDDFEIQKAAIVTCGHIKNPKLIEALLPFLEIKYLKKTALNALGQFGEPVFEYLLVPGFREKHEMEAIKLCARIGGAKAVDILFADYFENAKAETLDEVLKALDRVNADIKDHHNTISRKIEEELQFCFLCLQIEFFTSPNEGYGILTTAINHEIDNSKSRLFHLLALLYERKVIEKARTVYLSPDKESRANALEYLENVIDRNLKIKLFPILEKIPTDQKIELLSKLIPQEFEFSEQNIPSIILKIDENPYLQWTEATALYLFGSGIDKGLSDHYLNSGNKLFVECTDYAIKKNRTLQRDNKNQILPDMEQKKHLEHRENTEIESMLEIEKILILKSTSMFSATPENILVGIAGIAKEERKRKGENIFVKDDLGNCLYIICEGDISIHIDGKELSVLHSRDIFGELALLDPEPRSATATALDSCLLLRIDQAAFNELIEERPEVAQGILTILSRRIRTQNAVIGELQAGK